jgi:beta-ureidopropionase / N-carbamoyl-L-amino-acid hydrolase
VSFDGMWAELDPIGRMPSGGYRRFAWTAADAVLREWFAATAARCGLAVAVDAAGNQWAWWGDPDRDGPGVVTGSHLDSVPDGGAFDGPLGLVSGFAAINELRARGFVPRRPLGIVNFVDEEGARFGMACVGSRLLTGALPAVDALGLRDADGITLAEARQAAGHHREHLGPDLEALHRIGRFVELHIEQGRGLVSTRSPVGLGRAIWPHGRWRVEIPGAANHAGTTPLADRHDAMLDYARLVVAARDLAAAHRALATCGKVRVTPNGVNAIPAHVTGWVDVRAHTVGQVQSVVDGVTSRAGATGGTILRESWTDETIFDPTLRGQIATVLGTQSAAGNGALAVSATNRDGTGTQFPADDGGISLLDPGASHDAGGLAAAGIPLLDTGAGHDAGILSAAGIPSAMIFVRNPTGVSHSPEEHADSADCLAGVTALTRVLELLAS